MVVSKLQSRLILIQYIRVGIVGILYPFLTIKNIRKTVSIVQVLVNSFAYYSMVTWDHEWAWDVVLYKRQSK